MRLWTIHPKYLDARGLVALWREALLAQAVLNGQTRGYLHHPQLIRFRAAPTPLETIGSYLQDVHVEATRRGYRFNAAKIITCEPADRLVATQGQLDFEWNHLKGKLRVRDPSRFKNIQYVSDPDPHPLFRILPGSVADWEVTHLPRANR